MFVCSVVFFPWALPRETVSGILGRWKLNHGWKKSVALPFSWIVDRIYFWEPNHCVEIAKQELELRQNLYDDQSLHWP